MGLVRVGALAVTLFAVGSIAWAEPPSKSLRPVARSTIVGLIAKPLEPAVSPAVQVSNTAAGTLRPRPRPSNLVAAPVVSASAPAASSPEPAPRKGLFGLLRPAKRPDSAGAAGKEAEKKPSKKGSSTPVKGAICGDPALRGETLAPIRAKTKGCGISDPVRLTSVNGIKLSNGATINCETARAFKDWVSTAVEPIYGRGKIVEIHVAASYACRPRNNQRGNRVSEHGRGNAIDISGFTFANGKQISVKSGFDKKMRQAHKAACGIFGTTLGPGSDGFHEDHLHFDIARHRGGPYCR